MTGGLCPPHDRLGTKVSVFAWCSKGCTLDMISSFLQSLIPPAVVALNADSQMPHDSGLALEFQSWQLGAISWSRNLEEQLSCYVSTLSAILSSRDPGISLAVGKARPGFRTGRHDFPLHKCPCKAGIKFMGCNRLTFSC